MDPSCVLAWVLTQLDRASHGLWCNSQVFCSCDGLRCDCPWSWWCHQMETFSALLAICAGNSPHKGLWRGALTVSLICARINGWVNNREAGDLRRHRTHYDVTVVFFFLLPEQAFEETVEAPAISDSMTLIWRHCNDSVSVYLNAGIKNVWTINITSLQISTLYKNLIFRRTAKYFVWNF